MTLRVGLVVPHIFMHRDILPQVIFSPGTLALVLANGLVASGVETTLFTPGPVDTAAHNITADLHYFEQELVGRGDNYVDLLKKHPFTFITLARQVQAEIIAKAYAMANAGELDVIHVYTNEEELALAFAKLCVKPVVFTHHDPFNFLVKYKNLMPKYARANWISLSYAQRKSMPVNTNWVANIYHGLPEKRLRPIYKAPADDYVAYIGRIIEPKGVHLAIAAIEQYNQIHPSQPFTLKIAGKHYSGHAKDSYWRERIHPHFSKYIIDAGYIAARKRRAFLGNARALLVPSIFEEPFGMVAIEALACGTPVIALDSGALPEIIDTQATGTIVQKVYAGGTLDEAATARALAAALEHTDTFSRLLCRRNFELRFTAERMVSEHIAVYKRLIK